MTKNKRLLVACLVARETAISYLREAMRSRRDQYIRSSKCY